jgi:hypothetical protein
VITLSRRKLILALVIWFATVVGPAYYFYTQYQHSVALLGNPNAAGQEEAKTLTDKISRYVELPKGETPSIATVSDKAKVAGQPFFARAEVGDKVLIFSTAHKAILYRPSSDKIIEIAPLGIAQS